MGICKSKGKKKKNIGEKPEKINHQKRGNESGSPEKNPKEKTEKPIETEKTNFSDKEKSKTSPLSSRQTQENYDNVELQKENLSINSDEKHNIFLIKFPASIGEIELPIFVNKDEQIEISIDNNHPNRRSFINDRIINYKGYKDILYKNKNLGSIFCRISSNRILYYLDNDIISFKADSPGSLILSCNLDLDDFSYYHFKGCVHLKIKGGQKKSYLELSRNCNYKLSNYSSENIINEKEEQILRYINMLRISPQKFCEDYLYYINENESIIKLLKECTNLNEITLDSNLVKVAQTHNKDLCDNGTIGHIGTNKSTIKDRISNVEKNIKYFGENLYYGIENPLLIVISMIIDKNDIEVKNRINLLDPNFTHFGISLMEHPIYEFSCVIDFIQSNN